MEAGAQVAGRARGLELPRFRARTEMRRPIIAMVVGLTLLGIATAGMLRGREPFASFYYLFAWYSTLLAADGAVALVGGAGERGRFLFLDRPLHLLTVLGWSTVIWFFYELLNFRLRNWYYVFLPPDPALRWLGTAVSFATVLPAVFLAEALLDGLRVAHRTRWRRVRVTPRFLRGLRIAGGVMMALVLIWPHWFFPLVWGATTLLVEPGVYRRAPERSLLHDLEQGRPGRALRLLLGGAAIGLLWEAFNIHARMKWIYTVPGLEDLKLFEMPVLGFFGFPPFALECFVLWQALVAGGLAVPREGRAMAARARDRLGAGIAAVAFCAAVMLGMESRTISSLSPRLADLPDVPATRLNAAGYDVFSLAATPPVVVAESTGGRVADANEWVATARLATLRGIGSRNVERLRSVGITTIPALAEADPERLIGELARITGETYVAARVRVWVRGARGAVD